MNHFPIFLSVTGQRIVVSGGGAAALAKLRLLMKTRADIAVFATDPAPEIRDWASDGKLTLTERAVTNRDLKDAVLFYAANEDKSEDALTAALARAAGVLVNIVDNLVDSAFITPAVVDRDPVTVAIGTEGAAPVLARAIKRDLEGHLPQRLGLLARVGKAFRPLAEKLPTGRARRDFWADYYFNTGPRAQTAQGARDALTSLLKDHQAGVQTPGRVDFIGTGPGDPELLTLKARNLLDRADVVFHDTDLAPEILELARREADVVRIDGNAPSANTAMIEHARSGAHVVRLLPGDANEVITSAALDLAGIDWSVVPGVAAPHSTNTISKGLAA